MGVFTRFKDIISSNINTILDNAEDPEKMLNMMIHEMEDTLVELKSSCASRIGAKRDLEDEMETVEGRIERWETRARLAISRNEEELAKEALYEKRNVAKELEYLKDDIAEYDRMISESRKDIEQLENKLDETIKKHDILVQRSRHASEKEKAGRILRNTKSYRTGERFSRFENIVKKMEREAGVYETEEDSLDKKFEKMETEKEILSELDELKKNMDK